MWGHGVILQGILFLAAAYGLLGTETTRRLLLCCHGIYASYDEANSVFVRGKHGCLLFVFDCLPGRAQLGHI